MDVGSDKNVDTEVARGFGKKWSTFRQNESSLARAQRAVGALGGIAVVLWASTPFFTAVLVCRQSFYVMRTDAYD